MQLEKGDWVYIRADMFDGDSLLKPSLYESMKGNEVTVQVKNLGGAMNPQKVLSEDVINNFQGQWLPNRSLHGTKYYGNMGTMKDK
jgi:hypothetical protein